MEGYKLWRISECRWTVPRRMRTASGQTTIYSGNEELHEEGVVMMISRQAVKSLMEWTPISNRTITARNYTSCKRVAMIQGYASHNEYIRCCRKSEMDATRMTSLSSQGTLTPRFGVIISGTKELWTFMDLVYKIKMERNFNFVNSVRQTDCGHMSIVSSQKHSQSDMDICEWKSEWAVRSSQNSGRERQLTVCSNWKAITLMPLASKVLSKILINRMRCGIDYTASNLYSQ